jgi:hypothetical protein
MRLVLLLRVFAATTALAALLPLTASAWSERSGPVPNVRPLVETGYDVPAWFPEYRRGAGLGFGFEIEQSRATSLLFRVQWRRLWGPRSLYAYPYYYPYSSRSTGLSLVQWNVGVRGYLRPRGTWRPYGELAVGLRLAEGFEEIEGLVLSPRVGIAWASYEDAGLTLDAGMEMAAREPNRYVIVPIRLAVAFP